MTSPYGIRGVICERFGWTYDYLMNGIRWPEVNAMMVDAPQFVPDDSDDSDDNKKVNKTKSTKKAKTPGQKLNNFLSQHLGNE